LEFEMNRTIVALAILSLSGGVYASPGDDGCVGNCAPNGGGDIPSSPPITATGGNGYAGAAAGAISGAAAGSTATNHNDVVVDVGVDSHNQNVGTNKQSSTNSNLNYSGLNDNRRTTTNNTHVDMSRSSYNEATKMEYSGSYKLKNTPNPYAVAPPPSAPCYIGVAGSYTGPGIGVSLSGSVYDKGCEVRETVRLGYSSSNEQTRMLADQVIQSKLLEYIDEDIERQLEEKRAEIKRDTDPFAWQDR
jgi:hypothetical protein